MKRCLKMFDPRKDLKQDHLLWELVLACATQYKDKIIYGILHALRCAGSHLNIKDNTLFFKFSTEFSDIQKQTIKEKYISHYTKEIKQIFNFVADFYTKERNLNECKQ